MTIKDELKEAHQKIRAIGSKIDFSYKDIDMTVKVLDQWKKIGTNVYAISCVLNSETCTIINVRFEKGGILPYHKHETSRKHIHIIDGEIHDFVADKTFVSGQVHTIPAGEYHGIKSDYALCTISFLPPYPIIEAVIE